MQFSWCKLFWVLSAAVALPTMAWCAGLGRDAAPVAAVPEVRTIAREIPARATSLAMPPVSSGLPPVSPRRNQPVAMAVEVIEGGSWKQVEVRVTAVPEPSSSLLLLPAGLLVLRRRRPER